MDRQTVDFGIDLGTTNSAIARATTKRVQVVKSRHMTDTTPSAVAHTVAGQVVTGQDALFKPDLLTATRFKRLMGTANRLRLLDGAELLPEELSSEVLKDLKASVQLRFDIELKNVVVTVPAMFQQPQCEATHRAAALAGLNAVSLLQEPIAAATAYLNDDPGEGDYLVYDLGGGTFDVSIVRLRDGQMSVVAHGGDNYLGGSDFDQSLANWAVNILEQRHGVLPQLAHASARYRLLRECEEAKIRLSTPNAEEVTLDLGDLGLPVASLAVGRWVLEDLMDEPISRTIRLARERLLQAKLAAGDIESVLLVGGATQSPYVRRRLKDELGIRLNVEQDPMTVVAIGAAIHASTLLIPDRAARSTVSSGVRTAILELHYEPVSSEVRTILAGKIVDPVGFVGDVRIARSKGDWETGWIPLQNGAFASDVVLETGTTTDFTITVRDTTGTVVAVSPASVTLRHGIGVATPITPYNYGVALSDGTFSAVIAQGQPLPAYGTLLYVATRTVQAGGPDCLPIYFLEGMHPVASDNPQVAVLYIRGTDISRTVREGERIEVRLHMDESRRIKARVSIPIYDIDYAVEFNGVIDTPIQMIRESHQEAEAAISRIQGFVKEEDEAQYLAVRHDLDILAAEMEELESDEVGAAEKLASKLSEAKVRLYPLVSNYALESAFAELENTLENAERVANDFDDRLDVATVGDLRTESLKFYRLGDVSSLKRITNSGSDIYWKHYRKTRECWIGLVEYVRINRHRALDGLLYDEWAKRAYDCLERNDYEGVRLNCVQAMSFLPDDQSVKTAYADAGIRNV